MSEAGISGFDKAAILFKVLGDGLAITLFKDIDQDQLRKIRSRAQEFTDIPLEVQRVILEEFYLGFLKDKFKEAAEDARRPFAFLDRLSDEQIAYLVLGEPSIIAAMVLAQLNPARQMKIYERINEDQRIEVLMELGESSDLMNLEAVTNVAGDLKEKARYLPKASEFERGGGEKLAGVLSHMPLDQADLFLEKLSKENPELLKEVKRYYITFDDIFELPDGILRDILNSVEVDDIALAMKGVDEVIVDKALDILSKKKQAMYEPVEGPLSKREINDARRKIMTQVRKMQESGEINIADILSGDMIE